jgi:hypothetical protein
LPAQYKSGIYEKLPQNIREFVLIVNDRPDNEKLRQVIEKLRSVFAQNQLKDIKMSGNLNKDQRPPTIDIWKAHVDLDHRNLSGDPSYGKIFLKEDRELAEHIVRKIVEALLPIIASRITATEQNVSK